MLYSSVLLTFPICKTFKVKIKNTWNDKVSNACSYRNEFQAVVVLLEVWVWKKLKVSSRVKTKYWLEIRNESIDRCILFFFNPLHVWKSLVKETVF